MKQLIIAIIIATILLTGCDAKKSQESTEKELLLYCGAGIRPPVAELTETFGREHGIKVVTNYAGSEVLLSTIKLIRRGDIYMPGDKHYVAQAADEGMILSQKSVCYFVPTILVQKGNPKNIGQLEDLIKLGVKLGLGETVDIGIHMGVTIVNDRPVRTIINEICRLAPFLGIAGIVPGVKAVKAGIRPEGAVRTAYGMFGSMSFGLFGIKGVPIGIG